MTDYTLLKYKCVYLKSEKNSIFSEWGLVQISQNVCSLEKKELFSRKNGSPGTTRSKLCHIRKCKNEVTAQVAESSDPLPV